MSRPVRDKHERTPLACIMDRACGVEMQLQDGPIKSQERLSLAINAAGMGIWDWDLVSNRMVCDEHMFKLHGLWSGGMDGEDAIWQSRLHPDDKDYVLDCVQAALRGEVPFDAEYRVRHPDGVERYLKASGVVLRDDEGVPLRMIGVNYDITESKRAEESLLRSEVRFRAFMDNSPTIAWAKDGEGRHTYLSRTFEKRFNVRFADWRGKTDFDVWPRDIAERVRKHDEMVLVTNQPLQAEEEMRNGDGSCSTWWSFRFPFYDADGRKCVGGIGVDITERKKDEQALRESETRLRLVFQNSSDAIGLSVGGRHIFVNRAYVDMFGYLTEDDILKLRVEDLVSPECRDEVARHIGRRGVGHAAPIRYETSGYRQDCTSFLMAVTVSTYEFSGEVYTLVIIRDITEQRRAEEERRRMELQLTNLQRIESLGVLAGGIAHDFNNLLGGIFSNIQVALELVEDDEVRELLVKTMNIMEPARGLTRQLLTFAKGGEPVRESASIAPVVKNATTMALSGSKSKAKFVVQTGLKSCRFDRSQLNQVVTNIAMNAAQAMPDGGVLVVSVENVTLGERGELPLPAGSYVRIAFKDEGVGIPSEMLPRIFDPFFSTRAEGFGLGLATAHSIVRKHGGVIDVESTPGRGSTFRVYLPIVEDDAKSEGAAPRGAAALRGGSVLVMDDEEYLRDSMSMVLKRLGYKAVCAEDGDQAIQRLKELLARDEPPVAAILDLTIPGGMGGAEVARKLRELDPGLPLIAASGYADSPVIALPQDHGFDAGLEKPCRKEVLAAILGPVARKKKV